MSDRTRLHELVDSLPEGALAVAQGALEQFQTWPLQEPYASVMIAEYEQRYGSKPSQSLLPLQYAAVSGPPRIQ